MGGNGGGGGGRDKGFSGNGVGKEFDNAVLAVVRHVSFQQHAGDGGVREWRKGRHRRHVGFPWLRRCGSKDKRRNKDLETAAHVLSIENKMAVVVVDVVVVVCSFRAAHGQCHCPCGDASNGYWTNGGSGSFETPFLVTDAISFLVCQKGMSLECLLF